MEKSICLNKELNQIQFVFAKMFSLLNNKFFDDQLDPPIINILIMENNNASGSVIPFALKINDKSIHMIKINISNLNRPFKEIGMTFLHEMTHLWQIDFGNVSSSSNYHNKEFSNKLLSFGIKIENIVNPESNVGYNVKSIIIPNEEYDNFFNSNLKHLVFHIDHNDTKNEKKAINKNKSLYLCDVCKSRVWGKPNLQIVCPECSVLYEEVKACQEK